MSHTPLGLSSNGDGPGLPTWFLSNKGFNSQLWGELRRVVAQKGLQSVTLSPWVLLTRLLFPSLLFCGRLFFSVGVEYNIWWGGKSRSWRLFNYALFTPVLAYSVPTPSARMFLLPRYNYTFLMAFLLQVARCASSTIAGDQLLHWHHFE